MEGARHYFRDRRSLVAVGGTYDEVTYTPPPEVGPCHVTRLAVEDETNAPSTDIRVYVKSHGYEHWLLEENTPAAGVLYWDDEGTFLMTEEELVARFTGATAADVLRLYVEGWWEDPEEPA